MLFKLKPKVAEALGLTREQEAEVNAAMETLVKSHIRTDAEGMSDWLAHMTLERNLFDLVPSPEPAPLERPEEPL